MSSSSSGGNSGNWYLGKYCWLGWSEGKATRCYAGDDNLLLRMDEGAIKVLKLKLTDLEGWHLNWAIKKAKYVKNARGNRFLRVFMQETVDRNQRL